MNKDRGANKQGLLKIMHENNRIKHQLGGRMSTVILEKIMKILYFQWSLRSIQIDRHTDTGQTDI